jgi:transposase
MNIACFKNNGVPYLQVQQCYSTVVNGKRTNRHRVIRNIGPLSRFDDGKPDYLKRLRASFKDGMPIIDSLADLAHAQSAPRIVSLDFDRKSDAECFCDPKNIGYFVLESLFKEMGIYDVLSMQKSKKTLGYDLVGIAEMLVFGRTLMPNSKLSTWEGRDAWLFDVATKSTLREVYLTLDDLDACSLAVQRRMNTKINSAIGRSREVCYYDVTNYFFEIDGQDLDNTGKGWGEDDEGLRKRGPSKAKNRKPTQQMGLFCDTRGIPISYKVFPGNHIDQTTLRPTMKESINEMGFERVVVVADGGLNSDKNICHCLSQGGGYIFSKSTKKSDKKTKSWIADKDGYISNAAGTFMYKSKIRTRIVKDENSIAHSLTEKVVSYWSFSHWLRDKEENRSFLEYLDKVREHPDKLKDKPKKIEKYLTKTQIDSDTGEVLDTKTVYGINEEKLAQDQALWGYYTLLTSEVDMPDCEIIDRYKGLSRIEDAFRTTKTDLEGRPVYVRTPGHINAHFLVCFIALTMIRLIQMRILAYLGRDPEARKRWSTGLSAERIKTALFNFKADAMPNGYFRTTRPDGDLQLIFESLGIDIDLCIPTLEQMRRFRFKILKGGFIRL